MSKIVVKKHKVSTAKVHDGIPLKIEPKAIGNDKLNILKHGFYIKDDQVSGVELSVKNISQEQIGIALFRVVFYDKKGDSLDTVEYRIENFQPYETKTFHINSLRLNTDISDNYLIEIIKTTVIPEPKVTDNERIKILKHNLYTADMIPRGPNSDGMQLVLKNPLDKTISSVILNVNFYDIESKIVYDFEHRESNIKPGNSRQIFIFPPNPTRYSLKSYDIKVIRVTTADIEKVQICGHDINIKEDGQEEITGTLKNLYSSNTDIILVANFYNKINDCIGNKAIVIRDIEPDSIKKFSFKFKPQEGDKIRTYNLKAICDIDWST